jgi:large subunit GTPase 1
MDDDIIGIPQGAKSAQVDQKFFARGQGNGVVKQPFHHQYSEQGKKQLSGRKMREMVAMEKDVTPADLRMNSKKHFKGNKKRVKTKQEADPEYGLR